MSKRAKWKGIPDAEKHPMLHKVSKKVGRSMGPLVMGTNNVLVTQKIRRAQDSRK